MAKQSKIWLSKSSHLKSLQCKKAFYLHKFYYQLQDKPSTRTLELFDQGHYIETKAKELLYSGGIQLKPKSPKGWAKTIKATSLLIKNKQPILYEAAFSFQGMMCAVDVLKVENNEVTIIEIKRGSHLKNVYLHDIAFQYYIVDKLGYTIKDVIFTSFTGNPDQKKLTQNEFRELSVLELVKEMAFFVKEQARLAKRIFLLEAIPEMSMGKQCNHPYNCNFMGFCTQQMEAKVKL